MSASLIGWGITLFFVILLVGGFLVGFWRGFKKSTANLVISIIGVIVAFFVTPVITNSILGIKVTSDGTKMSIKNALLNMIYSTKEVGSLTENNPNLKTLIDNLPSAVFNTIIFIFVTIAIEIVCYIVFKILGIALFKGKKRGRLFGGLVGVVKTFIVAVIACMPLAALIGLANDMTKSQDYGISTSASASANIVNDYLPNEATIVIEGLESNMLVKCAGIFGLDNAMFDYYANVKVGGEKVKLRQEIKSLYDVADLGYQLSKSDLNEIDYTKVNYDKLEGTINRLTSTPMYRQVLAKTISDVIVNYNDYSFLPSSITSNSEILDELGASLEASENVADYFREDLLNIVECIKLLGEGGIIDEIIDNKGEGIEKVLSAITSEDKISAFENGVKKVFDLNLIQDCATSVVNMAIDKVKLEIDKVGSSSEITDEEWDGVATSLTNIASSFGELSKLVNIGDVIKDPTILLDEEKNYNINSITQLLGEMLDNVRNNRLLLTAEKKPIVDKLLEKNNLSLPTEKVIDSEGQEVSLDSYTKYFAFLSPSLTKLKDEKIYHMITKEGASANSIMLEFAYKLSEEGKENLLSEIMLPLTQVEPTKSLIVDKLSDVAGDTFVNFGLLTTYEDWNSDLANISKMLIALNTARYDDNNSYLDLALKGEYTKIIKNISESNIENILVPLLEGKSTVGVKEPLFASLKTEIDNLTGTECALSIANASFVGDESQTQEVVNIFKKFVAVNNAQGANSSLARVDKTILSELLNTMKVNAYRVENGGKTEEGIFKSSFTCIVNKLKVDYSDEVEIIANDKDILNELGVEDLSENSYSKLDFAQLLTVINQIQDLNI